MPKTLKIILFAGALLGGFYFWQRNYPKAESAAPTEEIAVAKLGPLRQVVECTGRVVSNLDVDIKCKASGQVIKLPFDISDHVKEGDLVVELDPIDEERNIKQAESRLAASDARLAQSVNTLEVAQRTLKSDRQEAESNLKSAEARAIDAEKKAERLNALLAKKLIGQEEYDTARTASIQSASELQSSRLAIENLKTQEVQLEARRQDIKLQQAQVDTEKIAISLAHRRLEETRVLSPIDGVVSARNVQIGTIISSGISNVGGGTTVMTISDVSRMFVLASVDESDIGNVRVDQKAIVTADAYPRVNFDGKVVRIATKGVNLSNVVTFEVKIELVDPKKDMLKSEMTANVQVITAEKEQALLIPADAVTTRRGKSLVTVRQADGKNEERPIKVGIASGIDIEVEEGLKAGESIVLTKGETASRWRADQAQGGGGLGSRNARMMMRPGGGGGGGGGRGR